MSFEIVKGDYGRGYVGKIKDVNYSDCTGKIYIWTKARVKLIDGKDCAVTFVSPDTLITYTPVENDFKTATPDIYYGMFVFLKSGVVEHTLEFVWRVIEKEPVTV